MSQADGVHCVTIAAADVVVLKIITVHLTNVEYNLLFPFQTNVALISRGRRITSEVM